MAELTLFPVDTVKLRVQTATAENSNGFVATFLEVLIKEGPRGLYRGVGGALFKETIHSTNYWFFHGMLFKIFSTADDTTGTPTIVRLLINLVAKQLNWLCTTPFEVVSTVNQLSKTNPGFFITAFSLYKKEGIGAFYRGLAVSMLLAVNPAIMNTLITSILKAYTVMRITSGVDKDEAREHSAAVVGVATGLSKTVATLLTYPLIRTKVLQQTDAACAKLPFPDVLKATMAEQGVMGLYKGVLAMSYKTVLWNSLMMAIKHVLGPDRAKTPPASPTQQARQTITLPIFGREPFPVELLTKEKIHEIYDSLRHRMHHDERIQSLERKLDSTVSEIKEVKHLLQALAVKVREQHHLQKAVSFGDSNFVNPSPASSD
eukprot:TRINITY_DN42377_c0_g1_i1.p1 TRINITY_DN42377_c0_g1~~TRINITY_DN42377_c0_g1_i1.p1  ORF type:complete len:395 (+),score=67.03 TRINITY_DN42377_c0_g1_i1:61-1185(+)